MEAIAACSAAMGTRKGRKKRSTTTLSAALEVLEIARGHDGLLRGRPEPVVVLCAFLVGEEACECVLRHVERFTLEGSPPTAARPSGEAKLKHRFSKEASRRLLVVAAALERDAGDGVEEVFARLSRAESLSLFTTDDVVPAPQLAFVAARSLDERGGVHAVHLLLEGEEAGTVCRGDEWIGAAAFAVEREGKARHFRLPFRSADGKNDWTLVLGLRA